MDSRKQQTADVALMVSRVHNLVFEDGNTAIDVAACIVLASAGTAELKHYKLHQPIVHQNRPIVPVPPDGMAPDEGVQKARFRRHIQHNNTNSTLVIQRVVKEVRRIVLLESSSRFVIQNEQTQAFESLRVILEPLMKKSTDVDDQSDQNSSKKIITTPIKSFSERNKSHETVLKQLEKPNYKLEMWRATNQLRQTEAKAQARRSANIARRMKSGGGNLRIRKNKKESAKIRLQQQEYLLRITQNQTVRNYEDNGVHVLFGAAVKGDISVFRKHLSVTTTLEHVDLLLEVRDRFHRTPLHFAAYCNNINILHFCHSVCLRHCRKDASQGLLTTLHYAILGGHISAVEFLIKTVHSKEDLQHELYSETAEGLRASELAHVLQFNNIVHFLRGCEQCVINSKKGAIRKQAKEHLSEVMQEVAINAKQEEQQTARDIRLAVEDLRRKEANILDLMQRKVRISNFIKDAKDKAMKLLEVHKERTEIMKRDREIQSKERRAAKERFYYERETTESSFMLNEDFRSVDREHEAATKSAKLLKSKMKKKAIRHFGLELTDSQRVNGTSIIYNTILISGVSPPASTSGVRPGDLVQSVNGIKVFSINQLKIIVGKGNTIELTLRRGPLRSFIVEVQLTASFRPDTLSKFVNVVTTVVTPDNPAFESARDIGKLTTFTDTNGRHIPECGNVTSSIPSRCIFSEKPMYDAVNVILKNSNCARNSFSIEDIRILGPGGRVAKLLLPNPDSLPRNRSFLKQSEIRLKLVTPLVVVGFSIKTGPNPDLDPTHAVLTAFDTQKCEWRRIFADSIQQGAVRNIWSDTYIQPLS